jgi:parallel beta-helix repeat protein
VIQPGETCQAAAGTYNETLTLKTSGTASQPITLVCATRGACTVNSGAAQTLGTSNHTHYYTIDGLRFIGTALTSEATVWLGQGVAWSGTDAAAGNNGLVLRNCYIEGNVKVFGHNNLVENCELNGKNLWLDGIYERDAGSHDNTYRNNVIYNYKRRGIWSMYRTVNTLVEGNTIHDIGLYGINFDGAGFPVTNDRALDNHVYNIGAGGFGVGVFFEDGMNGLAQGNIIHGISGGYGIYVQNYGNGSNIDTGWHTENDIEYRDDNTNIRILNNVIYNYSNGIRVAAANGVTIDRNTLYNVTAQTPIFFRPDVSASGVTYTPSNQTVTNNIFFSGTVAWPSGSPTSGSVVSGNFSGNPSFVNPPTDLHLGAGSPACGAGAYPC